MTATTIAADPTAYYRGLAALGFSAGQHFPEGGYALYDNDEAGLRLARHALDGERVELIGWVPGMRNRLLAWKVTFDGSTPTAVLTGAITAAIDAAAGA